MWNCDRNPLTLIILFCLCLLVHCQSNTDETDQTSEEYIKQTENGEKVVLDGADEDTTTNKTEEEEKGGGRP